MSQTVDIVLNEASEGAEATVTAWLKQPGEAVRAHEPVAEVNTDKVTLEVAAPADGVLEEILAAVDAVVRDGDVLGRIRVGVQADAPQPQRQAPAPAADAQPDAHDGDASGRTADGIDWSRRLSPLVKRMLAEHDLRPEQIEGTGRGGRITGDDVRAFLAQPAGARAGVARPAASAARAEASRPRPGQRVPHTPMRRRIADHMVDSMLKTAPHVTALFEIDMSAVIEHRKMHKESFAQRGARLTFTSYFVAAAAHALAEVPEVNSRWHDDALELVPDFNIGVATALGRDGLIVPVVRRAQELNLFGIAERLGQLTGAARDGRLSPEDVQGGTFTITNHGTSGSLLATPIINQPQSGILGIGKLEKRVKVVEHAGRETIQILPMCYVTLTIDHRALDGFTANLFLSAFQRRLEEWSE